MNKFKNIANNINLVIEESKKTYINEQKKIDEQKRLDEIAASQYELLVLSKPIQFLSIFTLLPLSLFISYKMYVILSTIIPNTLGKSDFVENPEALMISSMISFFVMLTICLGVLKIFGKKEIRTYKIDESYRNYGSDFSHSKIDNNTESALKMFLPHDLYMMFRSSGRSYMTTYHDVQRFLNDIERHHSYLKRIENEKYNIDMNELKNLENNKIMNNLIIK